MTAQMRAFWLGNGSVAVFFYGFWLLGWWIPALDRLADDVTDLQLFTLCFFSFFIASFIPLRTRRKRAAIGLSVVVALAFSGVLYCLLLVSWMFLAPSLDPWF
jgi:hypothetical protein